jgi:hypothetical protein
MSLNVFSPRMAADSAIMSLPRPAAIRIVHDAMPKIEDVPLLLMFWMLQQVWQLSFWQ